MWHTLFGLGFSKIIIAKYPPNRRLNAYNTHKTHLKVVVMQTGLILVSSTSINLYYVYDNVTLCFLAHDKIELCYYTEETAIKFPCKTIVHRDSCK